MIARFRDAVRKTSFACGKASWRVCPAGVGVLRSGGANLEAVEPRPWRRMMVCLCVDAGG